MIERVTGTKATACPWLGLSDPFVHDVLDLYSACAGPDGAIPARVLPLNPPHVVWLGLLHYADAVSRARADKRDSERAERDRQRGKG